MAPLWGLWRRPHRRSLHGIARRAKMLALPGHLLLVTVAAFRAGGNALKKQENWQRRGGGSCRTRETTRPSYSVHALWEMCWVFFWQLQLGQLQLSQEAIRVSALMQR